MIPESYSDQIERVQQMAAGDGTWDLSMNDIAALKALLSKIEEQSRELVRLREGWTWTPIGSAWPAEHHEVIVAATYRDGDRHAMRARRESADWFADNEEGEWCLGACGWTVTHWTHDKPLPAPPRLFTSQEVYEHIPDLVAKAEEMEKQGVPVVDVPKVGE